MQAAWSFFLTSFVSLFAILDAIGNASVFLSITPHNTDAERRAIVRRASIAVFIILVTFAVLGNRLFGFFGVTLDAFRVAGGLVLLKIGLDMVEARVSRSKRTPEEDQEGIAREDVSVIPLAMPMLSGPGAISTVIVLAGQADTPPKMGLLFGSILLNALLIFIILRSSLRMVTLLGETGMRLFTRILGLILISISVQFILTGIKNILG
jgi:multiple antibiotic resistance protein